MGKRDEPMLRRKGPPKKLAWLNPVLAIHVHIIYFKKFDRLFDACKPK